MNDNVIYFARLHWIIFFGPILLLCFGIVLAFEIEPLREIAIFLEIMALIWIGITWVTFHFSSLTIKPKQVIFRTGIVVRQTVDISLTKIESIDIRQSMIGALFRYGTLVITGTGGTRHLINFLNQPLTCRRYIEQLMHKG